MITIVFVSPFYDNMDKSHLIAKLETFGFDNFEALLYISMLEIGPQPASVIAKKALLKRGHTYNLLSKLIAQGVVQEFEKDHVKYFTCCTPNNLISLMERKEEEMEVHKRKLLEAVPFLELIRNPQAVAPKVRFFQGVSGIKEIYEQTLQYKNENLYALGDFDHYFPREKNPDLNNWMWKYCLRRAKRSICYMGILNKSKTSDIAYRKRKIENRKLKMLKDVDMSVEVNIIGNMVAIISSSHDMVGLIIEDKPTADTLRNFHKALWKFLPDYAINRTNSL